MIKQIKIKNFQSHVDSTIDFDAGVNVIVGESDSGKSVIMRAIRWVMENRPRGDGFRNWNGEDTEVTIVLDNCEIKRLKTDSKNSYFLKKDDKQLEFKAFGNDIPEEVLNAFAVNNLNFQSQSDLYFILNKSAGEVAQHFNRMAKLDKIDSSSKYVQSGIRRIEQERKSKAAQKNELKDDFASYKWLVDAEKDIAVFEKLQEQKSALQQKKTNIAILLDDIEKLDKVIAEFPDLQTAEAEIKVYEIITRQLAGQKEQKESLQSIITTIRDKTEIIENSKFVIAADDEINLLLFLKNEIEKFAAEQETLSTLITKIQRNSAAIDNCSTIIKSEKDIAEIERIMADKGKSLQYVGKLKQTIEEIEELDNKIEDYQNTVDWEEAEFEKAMPEECPLCGSDLSETK